MHTTTAAFSFTMVLSGVTELTVPMADALFEAGCDDATPSGRAGVVSVHFDRDAETLGDAVGSALKDAHRAGFAASPGRPGRLR